MKCPECAHSFDGCVYSIHGEQICVCELCEGTRSVSLKQLYWRFLGQTILKRKRIKKRITLLKASEKLCIPVRVLSRMERGCMRPFMRVYNSL